MCSYNSEISEQKMLFTFNACMLGTRDSHINVLVGSLVAPIPNKTQLILL